VFNRFFHQSCRFTTFAFLAIMPLGMEVTDEKTGELMFGIHGGAGQTVTVIRDCSGNALSSKAHPFNEISGSVQYSHRVSDSTTMVLGVRGGQVNVNRHVLVYDQYGFPTDNEVNINYPYFNPHVAIEGPGAGLGFGYVGGDLPAMFDDEYSHVRLSAHIRLGSADHKYFLVALNENQPLVSAGGPFNIGMGYRPGSRVRSFTGFSALFYEGLGFAQQLEIELSDAFLLDLGFRVGKAHTNFDGAASIGIRFRIPVK
jgi:hypothetical protein